MISKNRIVTVIVGVGGVLGFCQWAGASQKDFLQGLGSGLGGESSGVASGGTEGLATFVAIMGAILAVGILLIWLVQLRKAAVQRGRNHPRKLMREVSKKVGLKPVQLKKLKKLSEQAAVSSPLVLLLCPSITAQTVRKSR